MAHINPLKTKIRTMAQVKSFITWAQNAVGYGFSPHISFADYIGKYGKKPIYASKTAVILDLQVNQCFMVCEQYNESLYRICWDAINTKLYREGRWGVSIAGKRKPKIQCKYCGATGIACSDIEAETCTV